MKAPRWIATSLIAAISLAGCGSAAKWNPFDRSDGVLERRLPAGATEYVCAGNARVVLRFEPDTKTVWVFYPDRQFRLDRVGSAADRFTNGSTTVIVQGEVVELEEDNKRAFADCRRKPAG